MEISSLSKIARFADDPVPVEADAIDFREQAGFRLKHRMVRNELRAILCNEDLSWVAGSVRPGEDNFFVAGAFVESKYVVGSPGVPTHLPSDWDTELFVSNSTIENLREEPS